MGEGKFGWRSDLFLAFLCWKNPPSTDLEAISFPGIPCPFCGEPRPWDTRVEKRLKKEYWNWFHSHNNLPYSEQVTFWVVFSVSSIVASCGPLNLDSWNTRHPHGPASHINSSCPAPRVSKQKDPKVNPKFGQAQPCRPLFAREWQPGNLSIVTAIAAFVDNSTNRMMGTYYQRKMDWSSQAKKGWNGQPGFQSKREDMGRRYGRYVVTNIGMTETTLEWFYTKN